MRAIQFFLVQLILINFSLSGFGQNFHSLAIEQPSGKNSVGAHQGKKVLVIATAVDAIIDFAGLEELQKKYPDLVVLELPVKRLAKSAPITKTSNSSTIMAKETTDSTDTNGQVLSWLTKKVGNKHFTVAQLEVGLKFFIDSKGELYAILPPDFKLTDARIDAILTRSPFPHPEN